MDDGLRTELESAVRRFFAALDRRDLDAWLDLFASRGEIVHDDGAATSPRALAKKLRLAPPCTARSLSDFRCGGGCDLAWVAYRNRVVFGSKRRLEFSETALLRRQAEGWRFLRIHYSGRRPR